MKPGQGRLTRRAFLWVSLTGSASFVLAACGLRRSESDETQAPTRTAQLPLATQPQVGGATPSAVGQVLPATPACPDDDDITPAQTEGPFYTPESPRRHSLLESGLTGTRLVISGRVLSTSCRPVAHALVDFWHADDGGVYDNVGYSLRGHQFTDDQGGYRLETIVPGLYPGRTRHVHVKVQAAGQPVLTTQLYFPDEPRNNQDRIFQPELLMDVRDVPEGKAARFDFALDIG